jgi:O-antigen/teichoic acid export membrane protein
VFFGLSLPAQGIYKIYAGLQQGWLAHAATGVGWVVSLFLIRYAPHLHTAMWFYLFATYGVQQIMSLVLVGGIFRRGLLRRPNRVKNLSGSIRRDGFFRQGQYFFVIQITFAVVWGSNQLILSSIMGPAGAAAFAVLQRLFMVVQIGLAILNAPLWAMYAEAQAHGEMYYIRSLLKRSMMTTLFFSLAGVAVLVEWSPLFLAFLSKDRLVISSIAIELMALWTILDACGNAFAMYLNGVGAVRPQAIAAFVYMVVSVPLKIVIVRWFGVEGMLVVMSASYFLCAVVPYLTWFRTECLTPAYGRQSPERS